MTLLALSMSWWWPLTARGMDPTDRDLVLLSALQLVVLGAGWTLGRPGFRLLGLGLDRKALLWTCVVGLLFLVAGLVILSVQGPWVWRGSEAWAQETGLGWLFLHAMVVAPLFEELCFRAHFQGEIEVRMGRWPAFLIVFFLFVICHTEVPFTVLLGAAGMGFLRLKTLSVWPAVFLHMSGNAFIIGSQVLLAPQALG